MKWYFNIGYFIGISVGISIASLIIFLIFQPFFKSPFWVILGAYIFVFGVLIFALSKLSPISVNVDKGVLVFYGIPWKFVIRRECVNEIIVEAVGIKFTPKRECIEKFAHISNYTSGAYAGYKVIKFANNYAIGAIIEAMEPITGVDIDWDKLKPRWRKYFEDKLYEASAEDEER